MCWFVRGRYGSIDVPWAQFIPSVLSHEQQVCLPCVCMDHSHTIFFLIKALPPVIHTWPQEAMGGCREEDPLYQEPLKPSGDPISRSHDRNAQCRSWTLLQERERRNALQKTDRIELGEGGWRFWYVWILTFQSRFEKQKDLSSK